MKPYSFLRLVGSIVLLLTFLIAPLSHLDAVQALTHPALVTAQDKKDQIVYITNTGEKYHRGNCRYLRKSKIAIKKSEAIDRGYEPCKVCKP